MAQVDTESDSRQGAAVRTNDDRDGNGSLGSREAPGETGGEAGGGKCISNPPATGGDESARGQWHGPLNAATCATDVFKGRPFFGGITKITTKKGREHRTFVGHVDPEDALTLEEAFEEFPQLEGRIQIVSTHPGTGEDTTFEVDVGERPPREETSSGSGDAASLTSGQKEFLKEQGRREARAEFQEEVQEARKRARRQEERADNLQEDLDRMNEKLRNARREADEARREKERELRNQRQDYRQEIRELEQDLRATKKELSDLESENQRLERTVEQLESGELPGGANWQKLLDHPLADKAIRTLDKFASGGHPRPPLNDRAAPSNGQAPRRGAAMNGQARQQRPTSRDRAPGRSHQADESPTDTPREQTRSMDSSDEISDFIDNTVSMARDVLSEQASTTAREFATDFNETVKVIGDQLGATTYAEIAERIARFAVENGISTEKVSSALEPVLRPLLSGSMAESFLRNSSPASAAQTLFALAGRDPDEAIKRLVIEVLGQLKQRL